MKENLKGEYSMSSGAEMLPGDLGDAVALRQSAGRRLRTLLDGEDPLLAPGCGDALSARLIEDAGFGAAFLSGYWCSSARGLLDIGLITLTELTDSIHSISSAVSLPLICDADTGFGDSPMQVQRCMKRLAEAGAAGVTIEDQVSAKKCGLLEDKRVIPPERMVQKIQAAVDASDEDLVVIARTDALEAEGVEGAINRGSLYLEAGADLLFVEGFRATEQVAAVGRALSERRLVFNQTPPGHGPDLSLSELKELGFCLILFPIQLLLLSLHAQQRGLEEIRKTGNYHSLARQMASIQDVSTLLGEEEVVALEERYAAVPSGRESRSSPQEPS
jgi:2-methylisocitrate lyase-like PEP mutase family enzyme